MPFLIRRAKKAHGMEISAAPGVLVGGINARRHAAPKTQRRSTTPAAGVRRADAPRARRPRKASPAALAARAQIAPPR